MDITKKLVELKKRKGEQSNQCAFFQQQLQQSTTELFKIDGAIEEFEKVLVEEKGKELEKKNDPIKGIEKLEPKKL